MLPMVRGDLNTDGPRQFSYLSTLSRIAGNVQDPFGVPVASEAILRIVDRHHGSEQSSTVDPFDNRRGQGRLVRKPFQHCFFIRIRGILQVPRVESRLLHRDIRSLRELPRGLAAGGRSMCN